MPHTSTERAQTGRNYASLLPFPASTLGKTGTRGGSIVTVMNPQELTMGRVFARALESNGAAPAVWEDGRWFSWVDWDREVQSLAAALQRLGVRPGQVVATQMPNSFE